MTYSPDYFAARESWRDWRIEANQLISLARVSKGTRVLEVGCGGGGLLCLLIERGAKTIGVDTLEVAVELARERGVRHAPRRDGTTHSSPLTRQPSLVRIGESGALAFRDAAFDAVVGQHVIEHLPDVDAALREWNRILKQGGCLALATPNARYPDPAHFVDADHKHVCSPRELSDAVERAGFSIEACYTIFPFLSHVRALRALGVASYRVFRHAPYFATRGRTILLGAVKR
jgi:SAM-dependent methyltransferase